MIGSTKRDCLVKYSTSCAVEHFAYGDVEHRAHCEVEHFARDEVEHLTHGEVEHLAHDTAENFANEAVEHFVNDTIDHFPTNAVIFSAGNAVDHSVYKAAGLYTSSGVDNLSDSAVGLCAKSTFDEATDNSQSHVARNAIHFPPSTTIPVSTQSDVPVDACSIYDHVTEICSSKYSRSTEAGCCGSGVPAISVMPNDDPPRELFHTHIGTGPRCNRDPSDSAASVVLGTKMFNDMLGTPYVVSVPRYPPLSRTQYEEAKRYWPINFHEDKRLAEC